MTQVIRGLLGLFMSCLLLAGCSRSEGNKDTAGRVFTDILDAGHIERVPDFYDAGFTNHGVNRDVSLEEDIAALSAIRAVAPPDMKVRVALMTAEDDYVSVLWTLSGTFRSEAKAFRGVTIWRFTNGRIREEWSVFDEVGLPPLSPQCICGAPDPLRAWVAL